MRLITLSTGVQTAFGAALFLISSLCAAQSSQPGTEKNLTIPHRGESMMSVENRFGTPTDKLAPIGEPPIARWVYPEFTVYFEYQYVINYVPHDKYGSR